MTRQTGLSDSEQTTTDMLEICVDSHREGHDALMALAALSVSNAPRCEEVTEGTWTIEEAARFHCADAMKEYFELLVDDLDCRNLKGAVVLTLVQAALSDVDWHALADSYIRRVKEANN